MQSTAAILEYYEEVLDIEKKVKKEKEYKQSKEYKKIQRQKELKRQKLNLLICSISFSLFIFLSSILFLCLRVQSTELDENIRFMKEQIEIAESENVRLKAQRDALYNGVELIEYAEKNLGMQKAEPYQIQYINLSQGDEIVVSGDKVPNNK